MEKGSSHENTVSCENERDPKEGEDDADEKEEEKSLEKVIEEKSLEKVIEEKLKKELSLDVNVKRRGPILWISTGCNSSI